MYKLFSYSDYKITFFFTLLLNDKMYKMNSMRKKNT